MKNGQDTDVFDVIFGKRGTKDYIYTIAEAHAIDLIAKTVAKTEIQVYENHKGKIEDTRNNLYWRLNVQPNFNENGTMFLYKLVTKLLIDKKALIVINEINSMNKLLYIADSFDSSKEILYGKTFSNIHISDNEENKLPINKTYNSSNTIYYSLHNTNIQTAKEGFKKQTGELFCTISKKYIKSNTVKWRLKRPGEQPALQDAETGEPISYEKYKEKITEGLMNDEEAIVMLSDVFDLVNLNKDIEQNLGDYKDMFKQISDTVANLYNIPLDVFYGSKTEKSTGTNDYITFAIEPIFELLEDGFNISLVGKESYLKGEMVRFNRFTIQHRDIIELANGIDKLSANTFSRNEINKFLKLPQINEKWADEHNLTKNYANVKGGGEEDE